MTTHRTEPGIASDPVTDLDQLSSLATDVIAELARHRHRDPVT